MPRDSCKMGDRKGYPEQSISEQEQQAGSRVETVVLLPGGSYLEREVSSQADDCEGPPRRIS